MALSSSIGSALRKAVSTRALPPQARAAMAAASVSIPAIQILSRSYASKLFIGGLAWGVDDMALKTAFSSYGEVTEARVIMDRETGRSRGFGFVSFLDDNEARAAVKGMDGQELGGRSIRVDYASDRPAAPRQDFGGGGGYGGGGGFGGGGGGYGGGGYGGGNEVM